MGFLEWMGWKNYKPDYGYAWKTYKRLLDLGDLQKEKQLALQDWQNLQQKAFGDIQQSTAARWGGTGADLLGIGSSLPTEWTNEAARRWMAEVGTPAYRQIEQTYLQNVGERKSLAEQARLSLEEQARAEALAKKGPGGKILGGLLATGGALLGGPLGIGLAALGGISSALAGSSTNYPATVAGLWNLRNNQSQSQQTPSISDRWNEIMKNMIMENWNFYGSQTSNNQPAPYEYTPPISRGYT